MAANKNNDSPPPMGEGLEGMAGTNNIAIRVSNLSSKCHQIYDTPRDQFMQLLRTRMQRLAGQPPRQYFREFWALNDVSFEITKSETGGVPQPMAASQPCWTGLGWGFILLLSFTLTRQDTFADNTQCYLRLGNH